MTMTVRNIAERQRLGLLFIFNFYSPTILELVVGFVETSYSVSERDGSVTVAVEIKRGTVGDGETVSVKFATKDKTATGT